jgi:hypothetical protein
MQSVKPWLAEAARRPGARLIWASTLGLAVLALATFYVSFRAQFTFMYAVKHQDLPALIEALIADVAMVVCSLLALGMACAGQPAKVARLLVVLFAGLSAGMNYLAADVSSFRSVAVYVMPPVVFAVCTDQTVAVIRRHGLGITEDSAWTVLGRLVLAAARLAGIMLLYGLRFILAPAETAKGLRRMVLNAAPLPGAQQDRPALEVISEAATDAAPIVLSGTPDDALPAATDDATVSGHPDMPAATRRRDTTRQKRRTQADIEAEALAVLSRQPRVSGAELGRSVGVSGRTGQRLLTRLTNEREPASTEDT